MNRTKFSIGTAALLFCLIAGAWLPDARNFDPRYFSTNNFIISLVSNPPVVVTQGNFYTANTNSLIVQGSAVAAVNSTYTLSFAGADPGAAAGVFNDGGAVVVYTNSLNYQFIQVIAGRNPSAYIYDPNTNNILYSCFTYNNFHFAQWLAGTAANPAPTNVTWTTLFTNVIPLDLASGSPSVLEKWPTIGPSLLENRNAALNLFPPARTQYCLFYQSANVSGIVRSIKYTAAAPYNWAARSNGWSLRMYCDGGNIPDMTNPPANKLIFNAPIMTLFGDRYRTNATGFFGLRSTRYLNVLETSTNQSWLFHFTLPALFTNGMLITLWDNSTNGPVQNGYSEITWEQGPVTGLFSDWRLRTCITSNTFTDPHTLIPWYTTANKSMLMGFFISIATDTGSVAWPEGLFRAGEWAADAEDTFLNPFFFIYRDKIYNNDFGTTTYYPGGGGLQAPSVAEAYRWWRPGLDAPIFYGPVSGAFPNHGVSSSIKEETLAIYYGP